MTSVETAFLAFLSEFVVGESQRPTGGGWQGASGTSQFVNYVMVRFGAGPTDGSSADPDMQIEREVTTTCVAATAEGCRILAKNVAAAVRGQRISTESRVTTGPITIERYGAVDRDDTVSPSVFMAVHVCRVDTVPA